jgi:hypothetical protein
LIKRWLRVATPITAVAEINTSTWEMISLPRYCLYIPKVRLSDLIMIFHLTFSPLLSKLIIAPDKTKYLSDGCFDIKLVGVVGPMLPLV